MDRYRALSRYLKDKHGQRVGKISLDAGLSCPNRDGTISCGGCIFCDPQGAGSGAWARGVSIQGQLEKALAARGPGRYLAYFQAFTNTYAPVARLKEIWDAALAAPEIIGLAVGTRPDCLEDKTIDLLAAYAQRYEVWLELGLQTANDATLERINRGHTARDFAHAVRACRRPGLHVLAHVILGLPGEGEAEVLETARFLAGLGIDGVKLHNLYVHQGTPLARMHAAGEFRCLTLDEYAAWAVRFLELTPPEVVIHRLTAQPRPDRLVAPGWCLDKQAVLGRIRQLLADGQTYQGRLAV